MINEYRNHYYGSILDPIHGDIKLSEIEKWVLAQPIFSRLRYVKQNTFLYYVFPSANHTRFEHSIGVMHMAGKIFDSCKENFATGEKKRQKYNLSKESFYDISTLGEKEPLHYQELRLAALLHDVGHGPMSHLFDEFCISNKRFLKLIKESSLNKYLKAFKTLLEEEGVVEHETLSITFILLLIKELKLVSKRDPKKFSQSTNDLIKLISEDRIVKMIASDFHVSSRPPDDKDNVEYTRFFSKIITGFPIDADRMDYLIRDSYFTGTTYGIYDLNRIYASFQARCDDQGVDLCFKESGIDSMLRFIQSRTHLYNQVYFHKTNRAVNSMLTYSTKSIRGSKSKILDKCKTLLDLRSFYEKFSDEFFVKDYLMNKVKGEEKAVLKELVNRKLFKRVYERKIILNDVEKKNNRNIIKIKAIKAKITEKLLTLKNAGISTAVDYYTNETFKDASSKSIGLAKKSKSDKSEKEYDFEFEWKKVNKEFEMSNMIVIVIRIYIRRTFHSSDEYKEICRRVLAKVRSEIGRLENII
jgi:uncharacterized protein